VKWTFPALNLEQSMGISRGFDIEMLILKSLLYRVCSECIEVQVKAGLFIAAIVL
jgi:hypothetical protein